MIKVKDFRSLETLVHVETLHTPPVSVIAKPKVIHYDVQRQIIKDRILQLIKQKTSVIDIVKRLKLEFAEVCRLEPSYVRAQLCLVGMSTTHGLWPPFYVTQEDFSKA